jgi:mannose-6-phosphate isomerase-like protein (cupin superfamily)
MAMSRPSHIPLEQARTAPIEPGRLSARLLDHGSMNLRYYKPDDPDKQPVHDQDEVYIIQQGSGWFVNGDARHAFGPGDAMFVSANVPHRFENFSQDLEMWAVFYGPRGGEG